MSKKQAFEVLSRSRELNDNVDQAIFMLLTCHSGVNLLDGINFPTDTQLSRIMKDRELLYSCNVDGNELSSEDWYDILDHCIRLRAPRYAIVAFYHMKRLGLSLQTHTITELLNCVCFAGLYEALAVFDTSIAYGMEPTVHNFSPLLKSCGSAARARELLQRMEHCGISPNVISYTAAIKSCEPSGDLESVLAIMELAELWSRTK